jgi:hypothetical protein
MVGIRGFLLKFYREAGGAGGWGFPSRRSQFAFVRSGPTSDNGDYVTSCLNVTLIRNSLTSPYVVRQAIIAASYIAEGAGTVSPHRRGSGERFEM